MQLISASLEGRCGDKSRVSFPTSFQCHVQLQCLVLILIASSSLHEANAFLGLHKSHVKFPAPRPYGDTASAPAPTATAFEGGASASVPAVAPANYAAQIPVTPNRYKQDKVSSRYMQPHHHQSNSPVDRFPSSEFVPRPELSSMEQAVAYYHNQRVLQPPRLVQEVSQLRSKVANKAHGFLDVARQKHRQHQSQQQLQPLETLHRLNNEQYQIPSGHERYRYNDYDKLIEPLPPVSYYEESARYPAREIRNKILGKVSGFRGRVSHSMGKSKAHWFNRRYRLMQNDNQSPVFASELDEINDQYDSVYKGRDDSRDHQLHNSQLAPQERGVMPDPAPKPEPSRLYGNDQDAKRQYQTPTPTLQHKVNQVRPTPNRVSVRPDLITDQQDERNRSKDPVRPHDEIHRQDQSVRRQSRLSPRPQPVHAVAPAQPAHIHGQDPSRGNERKDARQNKPQQGDRNGVQGGPISKEPENGRKQNEQIREATKPEYVNDHPKDSYQSEPPKKQDDNRTGESLPPDPSPSKRVMVYDEASRGTREPVITPRPPRHHQDPSGAIRRRENERMAQDYNQKYEHDQDKEQHFNPDQENKREKESPLVAEPSQRQEPSPEHRGDRRKLIDCYNEQDNRERVDNHRLDDRMPVSTPRPEVSNPDRQTIEPKPRPKIRVLPTTTTTTTTTISTATTTTTTCRPNQMTQNEDRKTSYGTTSFPETDDNDDFDHGAGEEEPKSGEEEEHEIVTEEPRRSQVDQKRPIDPSTTLHQPRINQDDKTATQVPEARDNRESESNEEDERMHPNARLNSHQESNDQLAEQEDRRHEDLEEEEPLEIVEDEEDNEMNNYDDRPQPERYTTTEAPTTQAPRREHIASNLAPMRETVGFNPRSTEIPDKRWEPKRNEEDWRRETTTTLAPVIDFDTEGPYTENSGLFEIEEPYEPTIETPIRTIERPTVTTGSPITLPSIRTTMPTPATYEPTVSTHKPLITINRLITTTATSTTPLPETTTTIPTSTTSTSTTDSTTTTATTPQPITAAIEPITTTTEPTTTTIAIEPITIEPTTTTTTTTEPAPLTTSTTAEPIITTTTTTEPTTTTTTTEPLTTTTTTTEPTTITIEPTTTTTTTTEPAPLTTSTTAEPIITTTTTTEPTTTTTTTEPLTTTTTTEPTTITIEPTTTTITTEPPITTTIIEPITTEPTTTTMTTAKPPTTTTTITTPQPTTTTKEPIKDGWLYYSRDYDGEEPPDKRNDEPISDYMNRFKKKLQRDPQEEEDFFDEEEEDKDDPKDMKTKKGPKIIMNGDISSLRDIYKRNRERNKNKDKPIEADPTALTERIKDMKNRINIQNLVDGVVSKRDNFFSLTGLATVHNAVGQVAKQTQAGTDIKNMLADRPLPPPMDHVNLDRHTGRRFGKGKMNTNRNRITKLNHHMSIKSDVWHPRSDLMDSSSSF